MGRLLTTIIVATLVALCIVPYTALLLASAPRPVAFSIALGKELLKDVTTSVGSGSDVLLLTNAKYVVVDHQTLYNIVVPFIESGFYPYYNLVPVHSPYYADLWIFAYNKVRHLAIYIELSRATLSRAMGMVLSGSSVEKAVSYVMSHGIVKKKVFPFNPQRLISLGEKNPKRVWFSLCSNTSSYVAFSVVTISLVWSLGAPPDLLLAAEFHNHICPGLLSGYFIYRYLDEKGLIGHGGEIYVVAEPVWCKDDLYAVLFDATPGKRRITVKLMPRSEVDQLMKMLGADPAGAIIVSTHHKEINKVIVVAFNFTKVHKLAHIPPALYHGWGWWVRKLLEDVAMIKALKNPSEFVKIVKVEVFKGRHHRYPEIFYRIAMIGGDLYKVLGIIKSSARTTSVPAKTVTVTRYVTRTVVYVPPAYRYGMWVFLGIAIGLAIALGVSLTRRR